MTGASANIKKPIWQLPLALVDAHDENRRVRQAACPPASRGDEARTRRGTVIMAETVRDRKKKNQCAA